MLSREEKYRICEKVLRNMKPISLLSFYVVEVKLYLLSWSHKISLLSYYLLEMRLIPCKHSWQKVKCSRQYPDRGNIGQKNSLYFHSIVWKWNWIIVSIRECISRDKNCWFQLQIIIRVSNRAKAHDARQYKWMRNQSLYFRSIVWLNISYYLK